MKILHVTSDWKWTGPAEPMLHAITGLRARGHEAELACAFPPSQMAGGLLEKVRARGVEPRAEMRWAQGYRPLRDRADVRTLREHIEAARYDIVHVHHTRDLLLARAALLRVSTPHAPRLVASWHRGEPPSTWPWSRLVWGGSAASGLTVLTEGLAAAAVHGLGWRRHRVAVIPGVVDAERFVPRERDPALRESLGLRPDDVVAGVVARLQPHRRFDLLLDAVEKVRADIPHLRVLVVGRGTRARQVLDEPVTTRGLGDTILRAGYRATDFADVLAQMDALIFLVPGSDGSCRAVLEAMAMEIPIIATRRGVLPDIVADGGTGRLIHETAAELCDALRDLADDTSRWSARGRAARQAVLARHQVPQYAERLEHFYAKVSAE